MLRALLFDVDGSLVVVEHLGERGLPASILQGPETGAIVVTLEHLRRWVRAGVVRRR